jgi:hypothetical protein
MLFHYKVEVSFNNKQNDNNTNLWKQSGDAQ